MIADFSTPTLFLTHYNSHFTLFGSTSNHCTITSIHKNLSLLHIDSIASLNLLTYHHFDHNIVSPSPLSTSNLAPITLINEFQHAFPTPNGLLPDCPHNPLLPDATHIDIKPSPTTTTLMHTNKQRNPS